MGSGGDDGGVDCRAVGRGGDDGGSDCRAVGSDGNDGGVDCRAVGSRGDDGGGDGILFIFLYVFGHSALDHSPSKFSVNNFRS